MNKDIKNIILGTYKKIRETLSAPGLASYSFLSEKFNCVDDDKVTTFLKKIEYHGIFDIEFMISNAQAYFVGINLQNGGSSYMLTKTGVNMPYLVLRCNW